MADLVHSEEKIGAEMQQLEGMAREGAESGQELSSQTSTLEELVGLLR